MPDFSKYYDKYSVLANFAFMKALFAKSSNIRKQSLRNRQADYARLGAAPKLLELHRELNQCLVEARAEWKSHDYGEGYFYQGLSALGITGLRDTDARVAAMELEKRVAGKTVLEVGCNSGFLSLAIAASAKRVVSFDINPHVIRMAQLGERFLERDNVHFSVAAFEDLPEEEPFDCVLSFANHSTYDGNTRHSIEAYFDRCRTLTAKGGHLLFESHPPAHEGKGLEDVLATIAARFEIEEQRTLHYGYFLDHGRTFAVARREDVSLRK